MTNQSVSSLTPYPVPPLLSTFRHRLKLLIDGVYDHLLERDSPEYKLIGDRLTRALAELCVLNDRLSNPDWQAPPEEKLLRGEYLAAIEEFHPEAVNRRKYDGPFFQVRQEQIRRLQMLSQADWAEIALAGRPEGLSLWLREYLAEAAIDPKLVFSDPLALRDEVARSKHQVKGEDHHVHS